MKLTTWNNCYDNQWSGLIVSEAFSHPAKFSPGLIQKIYSYGIEQGWFTAGDVIGDPFGGIGGGGIFAAYAKLKWVGVELEEKFCILAQENFKLHYVKWVEYGYEIPLFIRGDSRRFSEIVGECAAICTSPPFVNVDNVSHSGLIQKWCEQYGRNPNAMGRKGMDEGYDPSPGQIGKLKPGELSAVVTSPPYADSVNAKSHGIDWTKADPEQTGNRKRGPGCKHEETFRSQLAYSDNPANIGKLSAVVTSPPHGDSLKGGEGPGARYDFISHSPGNAIKQTCDSNYGKDPGNIGNLKMDGIVTSPPFGDSLSSGKLPWKYALQIARNQNDKWNQGRDEAGIENQAKNLIRKTGHEYGQTPGNIGNEKSETYWQAMAQVYSECHKALKSGGHLIVVVKAYVKNKKRVHLPMQTLKLLIHLGFEPIERIRAMLIKETVNQGLFGEDIVSKKERKSFFRRLAEQKGSPRIDFEEVLVMRK